MATAVVVLGLACPAPAVASPAPSMTTNGNDVSIAVEGASNSLLFFWTLNGSSTWHREKVAGTGSTFSAPSVTPDGGNNDIAAEGAKGSLDFYYAVNGSGTWNPEQVAPPHRAITRTPPTLKEKVYGSIP